MELHSDSDNESEEELCYMSLPDLSSYQEVDNVSDQNSPFLSRSQSLPNLSNLYDTMNEDASFTASESESSLWVHMWKWYGYLTENKLNHQTFAFDQF